MGAATTLAGHGGAEVRAGRQLIAEGDAGGGDRPGIADEDGVNLVAADGHGVELADVDDGKVRCGFEGHDVVFHFAVGSFAERGEPAGGAEPEARGTGAAAGVGGDGEGQQVRPGHERAIDEDLFTGIVPARIAIEVQPGV